MTHVSVTLTGFICTGSLTVVMFLPRLTAALEPPHSNTSPSPRPNVSFCVRKLALIESDSHKINKLNEAAHIIHLAHVTCGYWSPQWSQVPIDCQSWPVPDQHFCWEWNNDPHRATQRRHKHTVKDGDTCRRMVSRCLWKMVSLQTLYEQQRLTISVW